MREMTEKQFIRKYGKYIDDIEKDNDDWAEESDYWISLKEPYEYGGGLCSIHDSLETASTIIDNIIKEQKGK